LPFRSRLVFSFLLISLPAFARTWNVTDAASLQAAQSSSAEGDTISIAMQAQPYAGPVRLKNGQTLTGTGGKPRIDAGVEGTIILATANRIENIAIAATTAPGITGTGNGGETALEGVTVELNGGVALSLRDRTGSTKWHGGSVSGSGLALKVQGGSGDLVLDDVSIDVVDSQAVDVRKTAMSIALSSVTATGKVKPVQSAIVVEESSAPFIVSGGRIEKMLGRAIAIRMAAQITIRNVTLHDNAANGVSGVACGEDLVRGDNAGCNAAIDLRDVKGAVIDGVHIDLSSQVGINGLGVSDLTVTNSEIAGAGNEQDEHAMNFSNLTGHSVFTGLNVHGTASRALNVENGSGEGTVDVSDCKFVDPAAKTANQGILAGVHGDARLSLTMSRCTITHNASAGFQGSATGRGTLTLVVENNTFTDNGSAVTLVAQEQGNIRYSVAGNVTTGNTSAAISVSLANPSSGQVSGSIRNNTIGRAGVTGSGARCGTCNGIAVWAVGHGRLGAEISGNTIQQVDGPAIRAGATDAAEVDLAVTGNRIGEPASPTPPGAIRIQSGASSTDRSIMCATIGGAGEKANQIGGGWATGIDIVNRFPGSVFRIAGYRGDGKNLPAIASYLSAANRQAAVKPALTKAPEGNAFEGADACTILP
jgi:hypothetical protein